MLIETDGLILRPFQEKGAAYTEDYNLSSQHLCERLGIRQEGLFREFASFLPLREQCKKVLRSASNLLTDSHRDTF